MDCSNESVKKTLVRADNYKYVEVWTDGEWIKIGRDVEDQGLCMEIKYEEAGSLYDQFREVRGAKAFNINSEKFGKQIYVLYRDGSKYKFYSGHKLVMYVFDHELHVLRNAIEIARNVRKESYDREKYARSYINSILNNENLLEIAELKISKHNAYVFIVDDCSRSRLKEKFVEDIKSKEFINWDGVYINESYDNYPGNFLYKFNFDVDEVKEEKE